jgi:hypothetical protein
MVEKKAAEYPLNFFVNQFMMLSSFIRSGFKIPDQVQESRRRREPKMGF